ncbi:PRC-barrel domain-containing protein [Heyndrickxia acidicola]|uniref:PRC-barrel domain-containing protein n=1 Tax=Heyndrickxia acidicola TaxID=209389 RepID=A0ABU6MJE1_9BACI|nr:PRC-barrel domain-containing protein [Heyndrickxia acidicola]MED1204806.1 PRC-barrel domain-containing protein [Heyndrickxia acidicola]
MKKSVEITNLPIISILNGSQLGKVKDLVIDPENGSVDFLTVEQEDWQVSVKAIPFKKVIGIGEFAVMVENESSVIDLNEIPIANQLVNKKIKIVDTRIISRKGQLVGKATEYFVNDESGDIVGISLHSNERDVILHADHVMTYGKDIIIVDEQAANFFVDSPEQLFEEKPLIIEKQEEPTSVNAGSDTELRALKQKQIELLTGKKVTENIFSQAGDLIIEAGSILEASQIEAAQDAGPTVFVKLSMNIEE